MGKVCLKQAGPIFAKIMVRRWADDDPARSRAGHDWEAGGELREFRIKQI
jgi:hypothetical protein